jgi:hypothetical protein
MDFNGQNTEPLLIGEALSAAQIQQLASQELPAPLTPPACEPSGAMRAELRYWQEGLYTLRENSGQSAEVRISGLGAPVEIAGPWTVKFPPNLGAPAQIILPQLMSLHRYSEDGVRFFSGIATYSRAFNISAGFAAGGKRLHLDLGRVEVIAEVYVNGKRTGNVWKPPYRIDISEFVHEGENHLEVQVANLWPNRMIGDEEFPDEYEYGNPMERFGFKQYFGGGGMKHIPDWYTKGEPKPPGKRIAFSTWKWYKKGDPLLESGLLGPVFLRSAVNRSIEI